MKRPSHDSAGFRRLYNLTAYTERFIYRILALMALAVEAPENNNSLSSFVVRHKVRGSQP